MTTRKKLVEVALAFEANNRPLCTAIAGSRALA
jgi:hypothetical protein